MLTGPPCHRHLLVDVNNPFEPSITVHREEGLAPPSSPAWNPASGKLFDKSEFPTIRMPTESIILALNNASVVDCFSGGTIYNETHTLRLGKWYFSKPLPPPSQRKQHRLKADIISLCVPYADSFQHTMLDVFPKLSMVLKFIEANPEIQVCCTLL